MASITYWVSAWVSRQIFHTLPFCPTERMPGWLVLQSRSKASQFSLYYGLFERKGSWEVE